METTSLWQAIAKNVATYPELHETIEVDVVIIGGGITGVTAALELIRTGKKVAVIEACHIGGVTTSSSTGNLYIPIQPYYQTIAHKFDLNTAKAIADSRRVAIDYIEKNAQLYSNDRHFSRRPWFIYTNKADKLSFLEKEIETLKKIGVPIDYTSNLPFKLKHKKAAILQQQARFNPMQYVTDVAQYLAKQGCLLFENSRVIAITEKNNCTVKTAKGKIFAKDVIIATHTPIGINAVQSFTAPYRSYVVAVRLKDSLYPEGHIWRLSNKHRILSTHSGTAGEPNLLLISGNHHKTGQVIDTEARYQQLEKYLYKHFDVEETAYRWSAQHYHAADSVPYIGLSSRFKKHVFIATGFFADGLVYGTIAGILLADLILNKNNEWQKIYNSTRFTPTASASFLLKENLNVMKQYLKDQPKFDDPNYKDIRKGEGKIVEINREKWAAYRDEDNKLHVVSAVCTHMKCIVQLNNSEKSWDCPCHGSRFSLDGKVIEGPAQFNLKKKEEE